MKCRSKIVMIDLRVIRMMIGVAHFCENPMAPKLDAFFERKLLQIETLQLMPLKQIPFMTKIFSTSKRFNFVFKKTPQKRMPFVTKML